MGWSLMLSAKELASLLMSQGIPSGEREKYRIRFCFHSVFYIAQIRTTVLYILWLVSQGRESQVNYSSKSPHLKCHVFLSGCPVATGSHNLFARAPAGAHPWAGGWCHQAELSFTGREVRRQSLSPFTACFFYLPWKKFICPPPHTPSCLPTAPRHPKGGGFFCVNWLCLVFLQPFLCIPVAPSASRCLRILQPNTVCRPNTQTAPVSPQFNDTSHVNTKNPQGIHKEHLQ